MRVSVQDSPQRHKVTKVKKGLTTEVRRGKKMWTGITPWRERVVLGKLEWEARHALAWLPSSHFPRQPRQGVVPVHAISVSLWLRAFVVNPVWTYLCVPLCALWLHPLLRVSVSPWWTLTPNQLPSRTPRPTSGTGVAVPWESIVHNAPPPAFRPASAGFTSSLGNRQGDPEAACPPKP